MDAAAVTDALADPAAAVLDARTRERFAGTAPEPRPGLRGGHMPGSLNLPFGDLKGPDGLMRPPGNSARPSRRWRVSGNACTSAAGRG